MPVVTRQLAEGRMWAAGRVVQVMLAQEFLGQRPHAAHRMGGADAALRAGAGAEGLGDQPDVGGRVQHVEERVGRVGVFIAQRGQEQRALRA